VSRRLRCIPEERTLIEVTTRTVHGRYLLRPSLLLNAIILGVLARYVWRYGVRCMGFAFVSSHYHLLLEVDDAWQLARFMNAFNSKLAREIGRLTGWREKIWSRRYQAIVVSREEAAQIDRFKYVLSHGVKENLVDRLRDWPGVHAVRALLDGEALEGLWFDRTQEYAARRRGETFDRLQYATPEILTLEPLPCWRHLDPEKRQERIASLVQEIEKEAAAAREKSGVQPAGAAAILSRDPHARPGKLKKGPAPLFHAATAEMRRFLWEAYAEFVAKFRDAAEKLRAGDRSVVFPPGCFPPALPFVPG
jgi:putative transposase